MPFAALLAALAAVPDPRRAQGQRYSMRHLLLFSAFARTTQWGLVSTAQGYRRFRDRACGQQLSRSQRQARIGGLSTG